jgi:hypothetical protein
MMSLYKMDGPAFTQFSARQRQTASSTQIPPLFATFFYLKPFFQHSKLQRLLKARNHGCPRTIRELERVSG